MGDHQFALSQTDQGIPCERIPRTAGKRDGAGIGVGVGKDNGLPQRRFIVKGINHVIGNGDDKAVRFDLRHLIGADLHLHGPGIKQAPIVNTRTIDNTSIAVGINRLRSRRQVVADINGRVGIGIGKRDGLDIPPVVTQHAGQHGHIGRVSSGLGKHQGGVGINRVCGTAGVKGIDVRADDIGANQAQRDSARQFIGAGLITDIAQHNGIGEQSVSIIEQTAAGPGRGIARDRGVRQSQRETSHASTVRVDPECRIARDRGVCQRYVKAVHTAAISKVARG